jgi:hypothetical protein
MKDLGGSKYQCETEGELHSALEMQRVNTVEPSRRLFLSEGGICLASTCLGTFLMTSGIRSSEPALGYLSFLALSLVAIPSLRRTIAAASAYAGAEATHRASQSALQHQLNDPTGKHLTATQTFDEIDGVRTGIEDLEIRIGDIDAAPVKRDSRRLSALLIAGTLAATSLAGYVGYRGALALCGSLTATEQSVER